MPSRRPARRPAVELSQKEQQDRLITRRVNADRFAWKRRLAILPVSAGVCAHPAASSPAVRPSLVIRAS